MAPTTTKRKVIPQSAITKGKRCPVCGKRTLFVDLFQKGSMVCKTCRYKHEAAKDIKSSPFQHSIKT